MKEIHASKCKQGLALVSGYMGRACSLLCLLLFVWATLSPLCPPAKQSPAQRQQRQAVKVPTGKEPKQSRAGAWGAGCLLVIFIKMQDGVVSLKRDK